MNHEKTTDEIKKCCEDIKVLGKKDLRNLLSWWKALRKGTEKDEDKEKPSEVLIKKKSPQGEEESDEEKELDEVSKQIDDLLVSTHCKEI